MQILHVSVECYPIAKAGGLGDVVGSLPKYINEQGQDSSVIMPLYDRPWVHDHKLKELHKGYANSGNLRYEYRVLKESKNSLGFPIYFIDIPQYWYRPGIYQDAKTGLGYDDEFERYITFQVAVLDWLKLNKKKPDVIHCHDHHTALIPLLMSGSPQFHEFTNVPSVLTIHNGQYHGWYPAEKIKSIPKLDDDKKGYLFWDGYINALATGIRTCWSLTTVSETYMKELTKESNGLELLITHEMVKARGILNGIDTTVWDPQKDPRIPHHFSTRTVKSGKKKNKAELCKLTGFDPDLPLFSFIGRLVGEKGADLLPDLIGRFLDSGKKANFLLLGTGEPELHARFNQMNKKYVSYFDARIDYNEDLAHQIYAGADFILMPSRVEPCGLNQMYALRYGTIPIVRAVGGLKDSVIDINKPDGCGITFQDFTIEDAENAIFRAIELFNDKKALKDLQSKAILLDFSWQNSAENYIKMYKELGK